MGAGGLSPPPPIPLTLTTSYQLQENAENGKTWYLLSNHGVYGASSWRPVTLTLSAAADADVAGVVAVDSDAEASAACLAMESGRGSECLTMAPYKPYSAMTLQLD